MKEKVIEIIHNCCVLSEENITPETEIMELSLDSLSFVEMIVKLEIEFDITFDDERLNIFDYISVQDIISIVEGLADAGQKNT